MTPPTYAPEGVEASMLQNMLLYDISHEADKDTPNYRDIAFMYTIVSKLQPAVDRLREGIRPPTPEADPTRDVCRCVYPERCFCPPQAKAQTTEYDTGDFKPGDRVWATFPPSFTPSIMLEEFLGSTGYQLADSGPGTILSADSPTRHPGEIPVRLDNYVYKTLTSHHFRKYPDLRHLTEYEKEAPPA